MVQTLPLRGLTRDTNLSDFCDKQYREEKRPTNSQEHRYLVHVTKIHLILVLNVERGI